MTRGVNGLYIYAVDKNLRDALKKSVNANKALRDYKKTGEVNL